MIKNKEKIKYIIQHRKAFLQTYKKLYGVIPFYSYLHDIDKIFLLLIGINPATVSKIHRFYSTHHIEGIFGIAYQDMIVDWECAVITKPDKPMNAIDTMKKYYPKMETVLTPYLKRANLC